MDSKVLFVFLISCFVGALCQELCIDSCPVYEVFSECRAGPTCQKTCSTRNTTVEECACVSGCICKPGYFRDANTYKCIKKDSCSPIPKPNSAICARNEVYSNSLAGCQKTCYTQDIMYKCIPKSGCICADGYIRSPITNQCILIKSCDKCPSGYYRDSNTKRCELNCDICLDYNAEFKTCGDRCKELTCENPLLEGIVCPELEKCEPGCYCKAGYVKDPKTKKCIRPNSCPNPCKDINAEYSNCGTNSTCDMQTCRFPQGQGDACMKVCQKGCFCKPGYVKNDAGKCVLPKNCPIPTCKKNEIYECRNPTCEPGCLIKPCMSVNCENKCYCKAGYVKENGTCVLLETCKKCDDPNSTYSNCKSECSVATCLNPSGVDPLCQDELCGTGCFCKKGYVKDHTGKCILPDKCPKCPANEIMDCRNPTCLNEGCFLSKRACLDVPCESRCYCADGFARINGTCVPREKCNEICSDPNSTFSSCGTSCEPTCDKPNPMICPKICVSGCFCNKGYIKDPAGICIPIEKCPKPIDCPANEVFACLHPSCGEQGCFYQCRPAPGTPCVNKCFCAEGYRRINGICILEEQCPLAPTTCSVNEVFECRNPTCDNEGCYLMGRRCLDVSCQYKCYCAPGLVRIDGKCVPRTQCKSPIDVIDPIIIVDPIIIIDPIVECIPNASYTKCGSSCSQLTCDDRTKANVACPDVCEEGCFCRKGYFKNYDGLCVLPENCPPKCPDNEFFSCGSAGCEENCDNIGIKCTIVNITCDKKCFCKDGFIREFRNGPCISTNQCPRRHVETNSNFVNPQKMD